jgi:hypothetical protein
MNPRFEHMRSLFDIVAAGSVGGTIACILYLCWQAGSGVL